MSKKNFCRRRRIHDNNWNISQLNLINGSMRSRPYAILFSGIFSDLRKVSDQRKTTGALKTRYSSGGSNEFVDYNIENRDDEGGCSQ